MGGKRDVDPFLKRLLEVDVTLTNKFCSWANNFTVLRSLRNHGKMLEVSGHGILWFVSVLALMWLTSSETAHTMLINLFLGLVIDVVCVAMIKAATRRRRPSGNQSENFLAVGPDKFSFPSGHASRVVLVACFFIFLWPLSFIFYMPLCVWAISVATSRLVLRRHHLLDVFAGMFLGLVESLLLCLLWVSDEWAHYFISYLSDEVIDGGSYHV